MKFSTSSYTTSKGARILDSSPALWRMMHQLWLRVEQIANQNSALSGIGLAEIEQLVQQLAGLPGVEQVRAVAHDPDNLHEVTFEILSHVDWPERRKLAEKATALVIDTEWKLCDATQNEDWHFGTQMLRKFSSNLDENQVVASSYDRAQYLSSAG